MGSRGETPPGSEWMRFGQRRSAGGHGCAGQRPASPPGGATRPPPEGTERRGRQARERRGGRGVEDRGRTQGVRWSHRLVRPRSPRRWRAARSSRPSAPSGVRPERAGAAVRRGEHLPACRVHAYLAKEPFGLVRTERRERVPTVQVVPAARGRRNREGQESFASGSDGDVGWTGFHDGSPVWNWFGSLSFRR